MRRFNEFHLSIQVMLWLPGINKQTKKKKQLGTLSHYLSMLSISELNYFHLSPDSFIVNFHPLSQIQHI